MYQMVRTCSVFYSPKDAQYTHLPLPLSSPPPASRSTDTKMTILSVIETQQCSLTKGPQPIPTPLPWCRGGIGVASA